MISSLNAEKVDLHISCHYCIPPYVCAHRNGLYFLKLPHYHPNLQTTCPCLYRMSLMTTTLSSAPLVIVMNVLLHPALCSFYSHKQNVT